MAAALAHRRSLAAYPEDEVMRIMAGPVLTAPGEMNA